MVILIFIFITIFLVNFYFVNLKKPNCILAWKIVKALLITALIALIIFSIFFVMALREFGNMMGEFFKKLPEIFDALE